MENLLTVYGIPVIGAAIVLIAWRVLVEGKKQKKKLPAVVAKSVDSLGLPMVGLNGEEPIGEPVFARVYNCDSRMIENNKEISAKQAQEIKDKYDSLGRQFNFYGNKLYALKYENGEYSPALAGVSIGDAKGKIISPRRIGRVLSVRYSIALFYRTQMPQSLGGNLRQILWWSGVAGVIIFLMVKG